MISWRMLAVAAACLLLPGLGATGQIYEELPPEGMSIMDQDHNYIEPGQGSLLDIKDDAIRNLLLYKMLTSLKNQDVSPNLLAGPKWMPSGTDLALPQAVDLSLIRSPMMKRNSEVKVILPNTKPKQPSQKWKNKKGKARYSHFCYFKVCAFEPRPRNK